MLNARSHVQKKIRASDLAVRIERATSLEELRSILGEAAEELGLLEVTFETHHAHFAGPAHRRIGPRNERPLRVDCPIAWENTDSHGQMGEATLRF
jgi:hypothetical protein